MVDFARYGIKMKNNVDTYFISYIEAKGYYSFEERNNS